MRIAALDIGGTSIKSGIWDGKQTLELKEWDTNASRGGACLMARAVAILHTYGDFDAIGISTAGQVASEQGSIYYANDNIPGYTGTKIRDILEAEFGVPVAVENDVNAAALGELYFGAAKGAENFLCLTYGTGVGGAIVIDGSIYPGSTWSGTGTGTNAPVPGRASCGRSLPAAVRTGACCTGCPISSPPPPGATGTAS